MGANCVVPALFTSTSIRPHLDSAAAAARRQSASIATSACTDMASTPKARQRSTVSLASHALRLKTIATLNPFCARKLYAPRIVGDADADASARSHPSGRVRSALATKRFGPVDRARLRHIGV